MFFHLLGEIIHFTVSVTLVGMLYLGTPAEQHICFIEEQ